jgi:hypothetical protein
VALDVRAYDLNRQLRYEPVEPILILGQGTTQD